MTDPVTDALGIELTPEAMRRREAMLPMLVDVMRHTHRRKRNRKRAICALLMIGSLSSAVWMSRSLHRSQQNPVAQLQVAQMEQNQKHIGPVRMIYVQTDLESVARYRAPTTPNNTIILDDTGLLLALEAIGRPSGLVKTAKRTWLTDNVADALLNHDANAPDRRNHMPST